jgi:pyridoxal phosphate enzyme (YggS family)
MNLHRLRSNLDDIRDRIARAAQRTGRSETRVCIVAVTKRQTVEATRAVLALGISDLGENYPQELWSKAEGLIGLEVRWHLIGHLQSNKARRTLPLVRMIHAVDSVKLLKLLNELAADSPNPPAVLLQVNCSAEPQKHGWSVDTVLADAESIAACRRISISGLMTMAAQSADPQLARPAFVLLRETRDRLAAATDLPLPELSMGMSNDYEVAVEEGATWVRIGSALFEGVSE